VAPFDEEPSITPFPPARLILALLVPDCFSNQLLGMSASLRCPFSGLLGFLLIVQCFLRSSAGSCRSASRNRTFSLSFPPSTSFFFQDVSADVGSAT